ncbi:hypothetical protein [Jiangella alkaliphila]|uniref:Methyl-accepting transducer domain-containing protein n=1 Tax=Jiangella alkaliphila TaxID=419479 RepID=A0A1H2KKB5_9ACTN|nr:hypothetical protein [Jiangella alkaliphila]SDU69140.1 Short repeat-containing protein of unknown function [Jiangella alkaliphila]
MKAMRVWRERAPWQTMTVAGAVLSLLLVGSPTADDRAAAAEADPPAAPACERQVVLDAWVTGGLNVAPAAEEALLGDDAAICAFLDRLPRLAAQDDREQVNRVKSGGGPEVAAAANAALRSDDEGAVEAFLDGGWELARQIDLRARVNEMKSAGGPEVRAAANAVLRNGSREALGQFVDSGWLVPYRMDLRATVNRAMSQGGPQVRAAANRALQDGSQEMQERFVQIDWGVAQARDNEAQTLNDLRASATEATRLAAFETISAVAQADRAEAESLAARNDAEEAQRLALAAGRESAAARTYAQQAAEAADRAAAAANVAVQAARAAADAARAAAGAAGRAATAAARAHTSSDEAWAAATAAELDAGAAAAALAHNRRMQEVGAQISDWRAPIDQIAAVAARAFAAADAAESARANTEVAGRAAEAAGHHAGDASAEARAAFAAAGRARTSAERARRATAETVRHANVAQDAAGQARDAATRAVSYAEAAGRAAASAAEHAGSAVNAAQLATEHANNAYRAAEDALDAAELAQTIYTSARLADAERLQDELETELSLARHVSAEAAEVRWEDVRSFDVPMRDYHDPQVDALIAEAVDDETDRAVAVGHAREVARYFAVVPGTWTSSAAVAALGEDDDRVLEFVRSGLALAEEQDDRTTLTGLMVTGTPAMKAAAQAALDAGWPDVIAFLDDPDYPERAAEERARVNRILSEARSAGNVETEEAANIALRSEDPAALEVFLATTHNTARTIDVRAKVGAIAGDESYGTEVRNGAQVALAGTTSMQVDFLEVEQHRAAERDYATATHNYIATSLVIETAQIAEKAVQLARTAQAAAADARGAAEQAVGYANDAGAAAGRAQAFATQAVAHAQDAAGSAERAAQSVRTAAAATQQAQLSARRASLSAGAARASAVAAAQDAASAFAAYDVAYNAQFEAHQDASEAARIAVEVFEDYLEQARHRLGDFRAASEVHCRMGPLDIDMPGFHNCDQYINQEINDPNGPLHNPDGYAADNTRRCNDQFAGGALDTCLSLVLSPLFKYALNGIASREMAGHRLADEYVLLTARDLYEGLSQIDVINDCRDAHPSSGPGAAYSFGECVSGIWDIVQNPDWDQHSSQWNGTFIGSLVPEELRFAQYNSILGRMYLLHNINDQAILLSIHETELATSLLRILPAACVLEGDTCPQQATAWQLERLSESIRPENNQGYLVDESGRVLDANGLPVASLPPIDDLEEWARYTVESGLHEDLAALEQRIGLLFRQSFGLPMAPPTWQLETQLAHRVATREVALRNNTLRLVMNNPGGVCDAVPPETRPDDQRQVVAGCVQAIKMLLPAGTTMIIYYPDPENPGELLEVTVRGVGTWLD